MAKSKNMPGRYGLAQTNWCIITGAPCSGKTAVVTELARRGFSVVHEAARAYIETQLAAGLSLDRIRGDNDVFERRILERKMAVECRLDTNKTVFFDRAVPDSVAYFRLAGLDPSEPMAFGRQVRYKRVFLMERLPVQKDAVRREDEKTAKAIEDLLVECYQALEYPLIRIPVLSVSKRVDLILQHLE
jgi:predicted ATPase